MHQSSGASLMDRDWLKMNVTEYWYRVMQLTDIHGNAKYPSLAAVVKMASSLSHGQADVERGFSINK